MVQESQKERAKRWDQLQGHLFQGFKWVGLCSVLVAILGIVAGATFAAVMNVTKGTNIQEPQYMPLVTVIFLFFVCISALLAFSSELASIVAIILWRRIGKRSLENSVQAICGHVLALAITGFVAGATVYVAIHIFIDWLKEQV